MICKSLGLIQANYIVDGVIFRLGEQFDGFVDAFNNCREQGYVMCIYKNKNASFKNCLSIYIYNNRHTDEPSVSWDYEICEKLYSEDAYYNRTVSFNTVDGAIEKVIELILDFEDEE